MDFPLDLSGFSRLKLPLEPEIDEAGLAQLESDIALLRDAIIALTAIARARGLGGHTGGPYDIAPEVVIVDALRDGGAAIHPEFFDEAGHRAALQYARGALRGDLQPEQLLHYREYDSGLAGHPEKELLDCIDFSSGRLGHAAGHVNGVALAHPGQGIVMFGSDGSQMEGNNAEAARLAVANNLNVKWIIDDNNVTIAGYPDRYLPGFDLGRTLGGQGFAVFPADGEDTRALLAAIVAALLHDGPAAVLCRRAMGPGVPQLEGTPQLHDVITLAAAREYFTARDHGAALALLTEIEGEAAAPPAELLGGGAPEACRKQFGASLAAVLAGLSPDERQRVRAFDSDLEGSVGLTAIREQFPECFTSGGVQERGNLLAAAGFGSQPGCQGVFATFSAFLEMVISEITMSRLNECDLLCHFSHAGVDAMSDNTCHFGLNNFFADNYVEAGAPTALYFPADVHQMDAVVRRVFPERGLRFIFSNRSKQPEILGSEGEPMHGDGYEFEPGRDEIVREGDAGWIVSYGDMLHRCLHVVETLRAQGVAVGLVNKPTLNVVDEDMLARLGKAPFILVVESLNRRTGLGIRYGSWLLERGFAPRYGHMGTTRPGNCGQAEQIAHQRLAPADVEARVRELLAA
ncbi:MAG: transketolase C-terminal domain-containing protein [Candidatus Poseidoniia archaeon]|jgi:transketolase|nr:transketolase C-terminal domain-containing protein [Candidatus Poseidoniia archaeon]MDP6658229.1 transketolase C-terminal domain-containing protein [Candidatus Poseidoniia archaeon]MDP6846113.1 transketolase C-terminal domain-containing protein [Candidatus Poseidoniia archaeon]MDP7007391.1 transketolase C-terminal domain-containing protein [Candidatus Poseidoniia archaeon]|tara:strand:+ start:12792 stop:14687 length:1896 start_codon:yes stop_codon:yes gene_type:complete